MSGRAKATLTLERIMQISSSALHFAQSTEQPHQATVIMAEALARILEIGNVARS